MEESVTFLLPDLNCFHHVKYTHYALLARVVKSETYGFFFPNSWQVIIKKLVNCLQLEIY